MKTNTAGKNGSSTLPAKLRNGLLVLTTLLLAACGSAGGASQPSSTTESTTESTTATSTPESSVAFAAGAISASQSAGTVTIEVLRSGDTSAAVTVSYATADGTATAATDYKAATGTLAWAPGDGAAKNATVSLLSDAGFNGTRTFSITLSAPDGAILGSIVTATVTIDGSGTVSTTAPPAATPGRISLTAATNAVAQAAGTLTITATRSGGASGAVTVAYATSGASAVSGTDYTAAAGSLSWANGDSAAKTFSIPISKATPFSGTKSFSVVLSAPGGGATLGTPSSSVVTITGSGAPSTVVAAPPGTLALAVASNTVGQAAGALTITVTRIGGSGGAVTVGYGTANNTAIAGTDYTSTRGVLSWANGDGAAKTFSVAISNATPFVGAKLFAVAISSPGGGATLGTPSSSQVRINGSGAAATQSTNPMGQAAAARLLMQATFGANPSTLTATAGQSYDAWFTAQAAATASLELRQVTVWNGNRQPAWWFNAINGNDQLRQRMAFALSQILVISQTNPTLFSQGQGLAYYYDQVASNALGNYRTLLNVISHSPEMGAYLTFFRNDKPNAASGVHADENYARELMQLFTIGLWRLNPDGSRQLDSSGNPISTYVQADVTALARVFTGWASSPVNGHDPATAWTYDQDFLDPMVCNPSHHDTDAKTIVGGVTIAAGGTCDSDMKTALDTLFNHPNVGPFVGKLLIQRFVTSNPSAAYVSRVAAVFANDGSGVRGNMLALVKAILTDAEATTVASGADSGRLREPVLRLTNLWRAFSATQSNGMVNDQLVGNAARDFGEDSLESATVFNFYAPDYQRSGAIANAGMVAPEFQITNENSIVLTANDLEWAGYKFVTSKGAAEIGVDNVGGQSAPSPTDMVLHTAAWESLAASPASLVDQLGLIFMPGQMSSAMRTTLINYVTAVPATTPANRVIEATALLTSSPQYSVQR
jgi:uncharacterized protein (DUF1800 family)